MFFKNVMYSGEKVDSPQISFFNNITEKYFKAGFNNSFNPLISINISVGNIKQLSLENKIDFQLILYRWNKLMNNQNILTNIISRFFTINKNINVFIKDFSILENYHTFENNHDIFEKIKLFLNFENKLDSGYLSINSSLNFLFNLISEKKDSVNKKSLVNLQYYSDLSSENLDLNNNAFFENMFFKNNKIEFYKSKIEKLFSNFNLTNNHLFKEYNDNLSSFKYFDFLTSKLKNNILVHEDYSDLSSENLDLNNNVFFENVFFKNNNVGFYKFKIKKLFSSINLIDNHLFKEYKDNLSSFKYSNLITSKLKNNLLTHKTYSDFGYIISKLDSNFLSTNSSFNFLLNLTNKSDFVNDNALTNLQDYLDLSPENYGANNNALFEDVYLNFNDSNLYSNIDSQYSNQRPNLYSNIDSQYSNQELKLYSNNHMEFKKNDIIIEELNEKYEELNNSFNELSYSYDELVDENHDIEYSNVDVDNLADEVYSIIERRLIIEKERRGTVVRF